MFTSRIVTYASSQEKVSSLKPAFSKCAPATDLLWQRIPWLCLENARKYSRISKSFICSYVLLMSQRENVKHFPNLLITEPFHHSVYTNVHWHNLGRCFSSQIVVSRFCEEPQKYGNKASLGWELWEPWLYKSHPGTKRLIFPGGEWMLVDIL